MAKPLKSRRMKSLESCCLCCIVGNMEHFVNEYRFGNNIPKEDFLFLQKMYSKTLFASSNTVNLMKYLDFLLNPYLKEIELTGFSFHRGTDIERIVRQMKRIGDTVTLFSFPNFNEYFWVENDLLELTSCLPNVEVLEIHRINTTKRVLKNIRRNCLALRDLDLSASNVDDTALEALWIEDESITTDITSTLVSLDLSATHVTANELILALKNFPNLEILRHRDLWRAIYDFPLIDFIEDSLTDVKYNLKKIRIFDNSDPVLPIALKMLALICPHISKFNIFCITSQAEIAACSKFHGLKNILFEGKSSNSTFLTVTPFIQSNGRDLTCLNISYLSISVESVLKHCPKLQTIFFAGSVFEFCKDVTCRETYVLPYLKKLEFTSTNFGDEMTAKSFDYILSSAPKLEKINLSFSKNLTYDFIRTIIRHNCASVIREIEFYDSDIQFFAAREILISTPNLTDLKLLYCRNITNAEFEHLLDIRHDVDIKWRSIKSR